jgi:hypothetical protein
MKPFGYAKFFSNFVENCLNGSCKFLVVELMEGSVRVAANVFALGAVADFGAQNCQHTTKVDARQNVQLTTSPAIEPNAC